ANLTLVRTTGRWRELVTTMALGAGEARMLRRVAIDAVLLTTAAVPLAWRLTQWSVGAWGLATASPYQILDYTVDRRSLGYLLAVAAAATIAFSIAPMWRIRQLCARGVFKGGLSRQLSFGLIAAQMLLAIVLLSGAGILLRSITNIVSASSGVHDPEHVIIG